jgi:predicted nucleic acid-binding protein
MRAYCDTSVLADLLLHPRSSQETRESLESWRGRGTLATSRLTIVELGRLAMRERQSAASLNVGVLPLEFITIGDPVLRNAASLPVRFLRALDAIHVASALLVKADVVLTRDQQMQRACGELGLAVA